MLRLVDARDAAGIPDDALNLLLPHQRTMTPPSLAVAVEGAESPLAPDADGWYTVKLSVDKTNLPATNGRITFQYPRDKLVLTSSDGKQPLDSDAEEPVRVDLRPDHAQFVFKARALVQTGDETTVKISVLCGEKFSAVTFISSCHNPTSWHSRSTGWRGSSTARPTAGRKRRSGCDLTAWRRHRRALPKSANHLRFRDG